MTDSKQKKKSKRSKSLVKNKSRLSRNHDYNIWNDLSRDSKSAIIFESVDKLSKNIKIK